MEVMRHKSLLFSFHFDALEKERWSFVGPFKSGQTLEFLPNLKHFENQNFLKQKFLLKTL